MAKKKTLKNDTIGNNRTKQNTTMIQNIKVKGDYETQKQEHQVNRN